MAALGIAGAEDRYRLLLEISRIVNAGQELQSVIESVAVALRPLAAIDSLILITVEGDQLRSRNIHIEGIERRAGDTFADIAARGLSLTPAEYLSQMALVKPLAGTRFELIGRTRRPHVANFLSDTELNNDVDRKLCKFGYESYVACPLLVRDQMIGGLVFARKNRQPFVPSEVNLMEDVSGIVATAIANALAYEEIRELKDKLQMENTLLREEIEDAGASVFEEMIGRSPAIRRVQAAIEKVAGTDSTVLILGETGTGKELVARAIHARSPRASKPLVRVNCAALPEDLIASELFGHERGAFTGAMQRRVGRFEMAHGGSLFLDEIGEVPLDIQVSLLRVLQEREFERLGGSQTIKADVRLIAASNRDLPEAIAEGSFRSDLYYRLNVFPIEVPPLRERVEDVPLLVEAFAARHAARMGRRLRSIEKRTMDALMAYHWPGNIRELQNLVERGVILAEDGVLRVAPALLGKPRLAAVGARTSPLRSQERDAIEAALSECGGRVSGAGGAAHLLRLPASTLESKIRALGIDKHRFRSEAYLAG